jgi:hypothetical protein
VRPSPIAGPAMGQSGTVGDSSAFGISFMVMLTLCKDYARLSTQIVTPFQIASHAVTDQLDSPSSALELLRRVLGSRVMFRTPAGVGDGSPVGR